LYVVNLTADIPFAALTLAAILLTSRSLRDDSSLAITILSGFVGGLAMLLRILGLPITAGLLVVHTLRAGWRKSVAFTVGLLPSFVGLSIHLATPAPARPLAQSLSSVCEKSWQWTWMYFTSYTDFWKASAIENHAFWAFLSTNVQNLVYQVGAYFIDLRQIGISPLNIVLFLVVLLIAIRGLIREVGAGRWLPMHATLIVYLVPVMVWDWPPMDRFLIPFLPMIIAGGWIEVSHIAKAIRETLKRTGSKLAWLAATICVIGGTAVLIAVGVTWWRATVLIVDLGAERAALLNDKKEAYQWLREHSEPDARIIAYETASAFLYSGRQGITPTVLLPSGKYRESVLEAQLLCMLAPAQPIQATYWIVADDDFRLEWAAATIRERAAERELEASHKLLFRTQAGRVRIYKLP
jgi:hypothetical protein